MNLFTKLIYTIMSVLLAIFPFGSAAIRMVLEYKDFWDIFTLSVMVMTIGLGVILCAAFMLSFNKRMSKSQTVSICFSLFALSMAIRVLCSYLLQSQPISDFNTVYQYAIGQLSDPEALLFIGTFPYLGAYALTLRAVFAFFPATVLTAQVLNSAALALIPIFLFLAVRKFIGNDRPAIACALLYAFNPSMIIYASILSSENISQVFVALFFMIHAYWLDTDYDSKKKYILAAVMGCAIALLNLFKPIMIVFFATFIMAVFCYEMIPSIHSICHKKEKSGKRAMQIMSSTVIVIIVALIINKACVAAVQVEILGGVVEGGYHTLGSLLYAGLNPVSKGVYDANVYGTVADINALYANSPDATRTLLQKLVELYHGDFSLFCDLQVFKHFKDWCEEAVYYYWTNASEAVVQGTLVGAFLFEILPNLYAIALYGFSTIGLCLSAVRSVIVKQTSKKESQCMFLCVGCVFLYALMLMVIETQGRYKSNIMPAVCVLGGIGMWSMVKIANNGLCHIKRLAKKINTKDRCSSIKE